MPVGLVDILRDFFAADEALRRLITRFRAGELDFEELGGIVADDEHTALFRLKERCHALFRPAGGNTRAVQPRVMLFDLAVGSLFHEAMKFRENFYQKEVYAPRVRALRDEAGEEAAELFREFEKILAAVSDRLEEGVSETEALLERTREQLLVLLAELYDDGPAVRFLLEHRDVVENAYGEELDDLLDRTHAGRAAAYVIAGHSYLTSGFYRDGERALTGAVARGGDRHALEPDLAYARGMAAYLDGDYVESVAQLGGWAASDAPLEAALVELAHTAVSKLESLVPEEDRAALAEPTQALLARLGTLRGESEERATG